MSDDPDGILGDIVAEFERPRRVIRPGGHIAVEEGMGGTTVLVDRRNPSAWIETDRLWELERMR